MIWRTQVETVRCLWWCACIVLFGVFLLASTGNAIDTLRSLLKNEHHSIVPLIGGLAGAMAIGFAPLTYLHKWWWIPLFCDFGSGLGVIYAVITISASRIKQRR